MGPGDLYAGLPLKPRVHKHYDRNGTHWKQSISLFGNYKERITAFKWRCFMSTVLVYRHFVMGDNELGSGAL